MAVGRNCKKTSPVIVKLGKQHGISVRDAKRNCIHAELDALRQANGHARGGVMYVARVTANGNVAHAKPCPICQGAITTAGVRRVEYTVDNLNSGVLNTGAVKEF